MNEPGLFGMESAVSGLQTTKVSNKNMRIDFGSNKDIQIHGSILKMRKNSSKKLNGIGLKHKVYGQTVNFKNRFKSVPRQPPRAASQL